MLSYDMVPHTTAYNIGVFLLSYRDRSDNLSLGAAFCDDFDVFKPNIEAASNSDALRLIVDTYL